MSGAPEQRAFRLLAALYIGAIVTANATAAKLIVVAGVNVTTGALAIPLVYLTTDLVNELYGAPTTRELVWMGFVANAVLVALSRLCILAPTSAVGVSQSAFIAVFDSTPRIVLASCVAYLTSSMLDVQVFAWLRRLTRERHFWLRKNGSTAVSQLVDTAVFIGIAFGGVVPWRAMPAMLLGQYLVKISAAPLGTPLSYLVLRFARSQER